MRQSMVAIVGDDHGDGEYGRWCRVGDACMAMWVASWGVWFVVGCVVMFEVRWSDWPDGGRLEVGGWSR